MTTKKASPFDMFNHVSSDETERNDLEGYVPFMINRLFGGSPDTVFFAQEMNMRGSLPKDLQYLFYFHLVNKRKRYAKWSKKDEADKLVDNLSDLFPETSRKELKMIVETLGFEKASEMLKLKGGKG